MQRLFLILWVLCTFKTVFLKPRSTHCNIKYWLLTTQLAFQMFLWYRTELTQFVFSLCSSLKVSSFNEPMGSLELWHTSQPSLYTIWKGWVVADIPSGPWCHRLRHWSCIGAGNETAACLHFEGLHQSSRTVQCIHYMLCSESARRISEYWLAAQLCFILSMPNENKVYLLYYSRHDNWNCASRHSWPSLRYFFPCAALVFSSSSFWAAGCVHVFLCRYHCSLPLKRLHVVVCSFHHSSPCN